jgi:uncharacterized protein with FMN-binding domain
MKRIVTWVLSTISIVVLLFGYHTSTTSTTAATQQTLSVAGGKSTTTTSGGTGNGNGSSGGGSSGQGSSASQKSTAQSRTVTGSAIQTRWGPVQVQLTVAGGKITDVAMLQYPNGNGTDQQISSYALPILMQDTMSAQSANIQMVSGATYTSTGYLQSLQSAIDQAGI